MLGDRGIDLRKEFNVLQNAFSMDILYVRATRYIRCRCFSPLYNSGDASCPVCFGNGHLSSIEKIRGIQTKPSSASSSNKLRITDVGAVSQSIEQFFLDYQIRPKSRDIIIVVGWDKDGRPADVKRVYEISGINEVRGDDGRVEFYDASVKMKPDLLGQVRTTIQRLPLKAKRILAERKRYVWPAQKS